MLGLFLGALCISFAPVLVKLSSLGPTQIGVFRCGLATIFLSPWLLIYLLKARKLKHSVFEPRVLKWLLLASFAFAADLYCWHRSVQFLGAGLGTVLANTQSLYLAAFGALFFKESLSKNFFLALAMAIVGIYLLVGQLPNWVSVEDYVPGVIYGLLTGLFYGCFILSLRQAERIKLKWKSLEKLAIVCSITTLILVPISFQAGEWEMPVGRADWLWVILLALGPQVIGWYLISSNLPKLNLSTSGLILLAQPVFSTLFGALFFKENLSSLQYVGVVVTIVGVWIGQKKKK